MADNVILNPGANGDTIAADDINGIKHQRFKIEFGPDGTATEVDTPTPLPVTVVNDLFTGDNLRVSVIQEISCQKLAQVSFCLVGFPYCSQTLGKAKVRFGTTEAMNTIASHGLGEPINRLIELPGPLENTALQIGEETETLSIVLHCRGA